MTEAQTKIKILLFLNNPSHFNHYVNDSELVIPKLNIRVLPKNICTHINPNLGEIFGNKDEALEKRIRDFIQDYKRKYMQRRT